ncbi:GNAT family N-acetyltransferase [Nocardia arthritidis]|uniref:GNAT family N-acetyltransferase n=1 Tax=Nocardia arthritidis TaxID=228602 RepID=UPI0007A550E3|nr:GNAT family N-acetyltransferase [Nocardia arthritidis]
MEPGAFVLAVAFADDPLMTYFWPASPRRREALPPFWDSRIASRRKNGLVDLAHDAAGNLACVALWEPAHVVAPMAKPVTLLRALGPSAARALAAGRRMEHARPATPHLYLAAIGTLPGAQGSGLASALLERRLSAAGQDCFLISNTRGTVPFYERFGFEPQGELPIGRGPVVYPMMRRK